MIKWKTWAICTLFTLGGLAAETRAAVLVIDNSGATPELLGATGVDVNGTLYDVEFVDGTCVAVFDGCDAVADFDFADQATAEAAAQALLDDVFIDLAVPNLFDTEPEFTFECSSSLRCDVWIPFAIGATVEFAAAINQAIEANDDVGSFFINPATDTAPIEDVTWARFTAASVPEPSTLLLVGAGLLGAALSRRRGARRDRRL
jgi:hypothetical protein